MIALLCLLVTLNGCSSTNTVKILPDESWSIDTPLNIDRTKDKYGDLKLVHYPQCLEAVKLCNADKSKVRSWATGKD